MPAAQQESNLQLLGRVPAQQGLQPGRAVAHQVLDGLQAGQQLQEGGHISIQQAVPAA
jgi:hypothetical protein